MKWAKVAQQLTDEAPLTGYSEEFCKYVREFRDNFSFNHDEEAIKKIEKE